MATLNDLTKVIELAKEHVFEYIEDQFKEDFDLEDITTLDVEYDGEKFEINLVLVKDESWNGNGKYQDKTNVFELCLNKEGVVYESNVYIRQSLIRTGSYYDDYYYVNEKPEEVIRKVKVVEEVYYEGIK